MQSRNAAAGACVGILYPGDLGSHLAKILLEQGHRVVTTLAGRSSQTHRLARETACEILASLDEVLETADVILSVVPPAAAVSVAQQCCSVPLSRRRRLYLDLNSIAPETTGQIEMILAHFGMPFVDGAIHGMANTLRSRATLYLSGPEAPAAARLFGQDMRVKVLGDRAGQASAFKMMISGMAKGAVALFLEMALAARQAGLLDDLLACYREAYPSLMALVDRQLPTYPRHAIRRGEELKEVEQTLLSLGFQPCMVMGARRIITEIGRLGLAQQRANEEDPEWSVLDVIEAIFARNPLAADLAAPASRAAVHSEAAVVANTV